MAIYSNNTGAFSTGCAISGRMLAFATICLDPPQCILAPSSTLLFHLRDRTQEAACALAQQIYIFLKSAQITNIALCRTDTGNDREGAQDEARIESIIQLIPGIKVESLDNEDVKLWSIRENLELPPNRAISWRGLIQTRSIELAQFAASCSLREIDLENEPKIARPRAQGSVYEKDTATNGRSSRFYVAQ